jgi:hypothetical protein
MNDPQRLALPEGSGLAMSADEADQDNNASTLPPDGSWLAADETAE